MSYIEHKGSQAQGIDYHQTCSPTPRITSVHMLNIMQLAVHMGMLVHQMDVKTAYCWKFNLSHDLHRPVAGGRAGGARAPPEIFRLKVNSATKVEVFY